MLLLSFCFSRAGGKRSQRRRSSRDSCIWCVWLIFLCLLYSDTGGGGSPFRCLVLVVCLKGKYAFTVSLLVMFWIQCEYIFRFFHLQISSSSSTIYIRGGVKKESSKSSQQVAAKKKEIILEVLFAYKNDDQNYFETLFSK